MLNNQVLLQQIHAQYRQELRPLPNKRKAHEWIDRLIDILFPVRCAEAVGELEIRQLELQLWELLLPLEDQIPPVDALIKSFFSQIPLIYKELYL